MWIDTHCEEMVHVLVVKFWVDILNKRTYSDLRYRRGRGRKKERRGRGGNDEGGREEGTGVATSQEEDEKEAGEEMQRDSGWS